jgi:putative hydrolase of the HAD superfamily
MNEKIRAVVFGIDDVLYDATFQTTNARLSAVKAMIEAGLPVDVETGYRTLDAIVKETGQDNTRHFDKLMERLGLKWRPSVVAAGVVAYRETSPIYLKPYPDAIPTLLKLRDMGYKLGCVSAGKSVKQWQKLVSLGLQHIFHSVVISEDVGSEIISPAVITQLTKTLQIENSQTLLIGADPGPMLNAARDAGVVAVRLRRGESKADKALKAEPGREISKLSDVFQLLEEL